jgi:hypothetical protein
MGIIEVSVMTREEVDGALKAYESFQLAVTYPANYADNLCQARQVLDRLGGHGGLQLSGTVKPGSIKLVIRR